MTESDQRKSCKGNGFPAGYTNLADMQRDADKYFGGNVKLYLKKMGYTSD